MSIQQKAMAAFDELLPQPSSRTPLLIDDEESIPLDGPRSPQSRSFPDLTKSAVTSLQPLAKLTCLDCCTTRRFRRKTKTPASYRILRIAFWLVASFILVSVIEAVLYPSYQDSPEHYQELRQSVVSSARSGRGNPNNEKVFIAANIVNEDLIRGAWGSSMRELVDVLGEKNVFVSIYENDSGNGTRDALMGLRSKLPCNSSVVTGGHIPLSQFHSIPLPDGDQRTKRIDYLAEVRNRALRPLNRTYTPTDSEVVGGFRHAEANFDRVLFLNDVYFSPLEAAQLLFSTNIDINGRAQYRAACAADFVANIMFYDTFVVRDTEGYGMGLMFYPWFAPMEDAESRNSVLAEKDAVPVRSCWGGMVAFDARLFQTVSSRDTGETGLTVPFRHEPEPFWEAAECCLIFADFEYIHGKPGVMTGVFLNPYIRVAYSRRTWDWLPFFRRYERIFSNLQYIVSKIGYPEHNPRRLHSPGKRWKQQVWVNNGDGAGGSFHMIDRVASPGGFCGQRRMFVMKNDVKSANKGGGKNWEKIPVPR